MTGWSVRLGLRLTFAGGQLARVRLIMMIGAVAVAVALLLGVSSRWTTKASRCRARSWTYRRA